MKAVNPVVSSLAMVCVFVLCYEKQGSKDPRHKNKNFAVPMSPTTFKVALPQTTKTSTPTAKHAKERVTGKIKAKAIGFGSFLTTGSVPE
jgi:hypothetical protein